MVAFSKPGGLMGVLITAFALLQATAAFHHAGHKHVARTPEAMEAHLQETRALLAARAGNIAIAGASDGGQYPRLEIRDLQKNADQWNLFLLALERFQAKDKNDPLSYYQIAGIHGRPFVPWNQDVPLVHTMGYCPHGQNTFGSWHRPYLAIYEQALYQCAQEVADSFPSDQQGRWKNALTGLRIPYFDWAADPAPGEPNVPSSLRNPTVSVIKPSGSVTINNPLYSYSWGSSLPSEMGWGPDNGWPITLRHPSGGSSPVSNNDEMNNNFGNARVGWRQRVFALMASKKPWGAASTSAIGVQTSESNSDSFESIHDEVHVTVGGTDGHMSYLDVAAFDPLFWIHHTNVDRLLAMYQLIVPDSFVQAGTIGGDTAMWSAGEIKDNNSPLKPFTKNSNGDFYSSTEVQETRALGYYYPETEGRSYNQVVAAVNKLYGQGMTPMESSSVASSSSSSASASSSSASASKTSGSSSASASASSSSGSGSGSGSGSSSSATPTSGGSGSGTGSGSTPSSTSKPVFPGRPFKDGDYDTVFCVQGDKFAMPGSYSVHCFLDDKPVSNSTAPFGNSTAPFGNSTSSTSTGSGRLDPGYVGSHTFLGGSVAKNSSNPVMVEGCIPLTAALQGCQHSGSLKSLHPDHVEPYLAANLKYKIIGPGGKEFKPEAVPNFHVKVKSCPVTPPKGGDLPSYGKYTELPKVNLPAGKPWTYTPSPSETYYPGGSVPSATASGGNSYPTGSMPWAEPGYCVVKQVIKYVDPSGHELYSDKMY